MKKIWITGLFLGMICWNCSEDKLDTYEGTNSVYFAVRNPYANANTSLPYTDTTVFSFVNYNVPDTTLYLQVNTLGDVATYERKFKVEVVKEETSALAGDFYDDLRTEYTIPADSVYGFVPVTLHRVEELRDAMYSLTLRLVPSGDFQLALKEKVVDKVNGEVVDLLKHKIYFSDLVQEPLMWKFGTLPNMEPDMGSVWSVDKYLLTNYLLDIVPTDWDSRNTMQAGRRMGISVYMRNYLMDMIAKGTAVLDEAETDGFMRVKGVIVPANYQGKKIPVSEIIK